MYFRNVLAGVISFGFGCGKYWVPEVFSKVLDALCFIDYDVKCKHGQKFIDHIDYERNCSTWYVDKKVLLEELIAKNPRVSILQKYQRSHLALPSTCQTDNAEQDRKPDCNENSNDKINSGNKNNVSSFIGIFSR